MPQKDILIMFKYTPKDDFTCSFSHQTKYYYLSFKLIFHVNSSQISIINLNEINQIQESDKEFLIPNIYVDQPQFSFDQTYNTNTQNKLNL